MARLVDTRSQTMQAHVLRAFVCLLILCGCSANTTGDRDRTDSDGGGAASGGGHAASGGEGGSAAGGNGTQPAYVFITSESFSAALASPGGIPGEEVADTKCTEAASAAGLVGQFRAFISPGIYSDASGELIYSDVGPADRIAGDGPWHAVGSGEVVIESSADLVADEVALDALRNELGQVPVGNQGTALLYWSGSNASGIANGSCNRWTQDGPQGGAVGCAVGCLPSQWRYFAGVLGGAPCFNEHRLLCFRQ